MQAVQRALAQRSTVCCQPGAASHSGSVVVGRRWAGVPFTTSRTRVVTTAAKKGKASQAKKNKAATKQKKSTTAPLAPLKPTQQPTLVPQPDPVATAAPPAPVPAAEPQPPEPTLSTPPPSPTPSPAEPAQPTPATAAASASSDPIPTQPSGDDKPADGVPVGGSGVAEDRPDTAAQQPSGSDSAQPPANQPRGDLLSEEEIGRLAELKRQQERGLLPDSNILQGALQEIELITWPTPRKALTDTVLVISIVAATGVLLFGYNILLSQLAEWWYHTPHPDFLK